MGVPNEEQGLAASIQTTSLQVGGGLGLAIVVAVVNSVTLSSTRNQTSSTIAAQLQGFHIGLYLITAFAVLGALVALVGIRESPGAPQVVGAGSSPVGTNACSSLNFNMARAAGTLPTKTSTKPRTWSRPRETPSSRRRQRPPATRRLHYEVKAKDFVIGWKKSVFA